MQVTTNIGLDLKAIKVDDYFVIVDIKAEIKEHDFYISTKHKKYLNRAGATSFKGLYDNCLKIIASIGKRIDKSIPLIVVKDQSVEELAELTYPYLKTPVPNFKQNLNHDKKVGFIVGYRAAKSSDKKYTEEDIKTALREVYVDWSKDIGHTENTEDEYFNRIIRSLNQPKLPDVINLEVGRYFHSEDFFKDNVWRREKLKTTTTPEGEVIYVTSKS